MKENSCKNTTCPPFSKPARWGSLDFIRFASSSFLLPPPPNSELQISVSTAGPQPRAPDLSGHCGTSTASARPQQTKCQIECQNRCQIECQSRCQKECQNRCRIQCQIMPERVSDRMSKYVPERMSGRMSEYMPERMSDRMSEYICHKYIQMVCQKLCKIM